MARITAVHASIAEVTGGSFVRGSADEGEASFVENNGLRFSRVCITGRILDKNFGNGGEAAITIEDDSGQTNAVAGTKAAQGCLQAVNKGDLVLIIGKLRERQERYVLAEAARKLTQEACLDLHAARVALRQAKTGL